MTRRFFKYYAYNKYVLEMLINSEAWYAKPESYNDPFDGEFEIVEELTIDEYLKLFLNVNLGDPKYAAYRDIAASEWGQNQPRDAINSVKTFLPIYKNIGSICLSQNSDSILMWSHYADQHKGLVVEFEISTDTPILPVVYEKELTPRRIQDVYGCSQNGFIPVAFSKHTDWAYEEEWRIAVDRGNRIGPLPGTIRSILFGLRMAEETKRTIYGVTKEKYPNLSYKSAIRRGRDIALNFVDYEPFTLKE